jgi:hypothetical protein
VESTHQRHRGPVGSVLIVLAGMAVLVGACSSSGSKAATDKVNAAPPVKVAPTTTPTTQPTAIGLRTNADEQAELGPDKPLTPPQRQALATQLVAARATAMEFPTVADATKAGYILAGKFTPGAGAHYVSISGSAASYLGHTSTMDPAHPLALIYEGTAPTSRVVGLMYGSFNTAPPEGFAGPNDHWHRHSNVCIRFSPTGIEVPYPADADVTLKMCQEAHGRLMPITTWMVHAWVVPGWESPQGVFSHDNPNIRCADGTYDTNKAGFCDGV